MNELIEADVYFGDEVKPEVNWKEHNTEDDSDDEPLKETPEEVIKILGFDPLEFMEE